MSTEAWIADYVYDPEDWEVTYDFGSKSDLAEDQVGPGEMRRYATLIKGPDIFCACVSTDRRTGTMWFTSEDEARAFLASAPREDEEAELSADTTQPLANTGA